MNRKIVVAGNSANLNKGLESDSHTKPSATCCIENTKGILAKTFFAGVSALLSEATPIADSTNPALKLAVIEKHMFKHLKRSSIYLSLKNLKTKLPSVVVATLLIRIYCYWL